MAFVVVAILLVLLQQPPATLNADWGSVLPDDQARTFARERLCNRPAPGPADATWTPDIEMIRRLEAVLARELQASLEPAADPQRQLQATDYYRQYAGLVIRGRRIIYINGLHRQTVQPDARSPWQSTAVHACDGGLLFFGAEYDVATGKLSTIIFNGGGRGRAANALPTEVVAAFVAGTIMLGQAPSATTTADLVVVNKEARTLTLYHENAVLKSYRIALGGDPKGHKQQEGDSRTPEGRYVIDSRNTASKFHRALHISYPNEEDRRRARVRGVKPGGDIMIHGLPNGMGAVGKAHRLRDWTDGCIAVTNEEIEEIWRLVPNGTRIEIRP